jgi:aminoglycoside phosphotransferase family enzyme/predicted kinase
VNNEPDTVVETHVSWVHMIGHRVYKQKKPIQTGFLDFSTDSARRAACEEEVRLGRRLAPDVYLGTERWNGAVGGADWVVVMRRMPADRRLSTLVATRQPIGESLREIAHRVATLHLSSTRSNDADRAASSLATLARWEANLTQMVEYAQLLATPGAATEVVDLARRYVAGRGPLFAERIAHGRAVDGHGDLLANDIFLLPDGPRILDAIEFDRNLRIGDGLADVAFLAMDLERLGRADLTERLLEFYAEFAADRWPTSLAHHYLAYRAQVRAKVACLRAAQQDQPTAPEADALLDLARTHLMAGAVMLTLVGGAPATGKSTIAAELSDSGGAVVLRSDEIRKELAGIPAGRSAAAALTTGIYSATMSSLTYGTLLRRARSLLERGENVIVDATWSDPVWRDEARRLATVVHADLVELHCVVPMDTAMQRAAARIGDASDAGPDIARVLAARFAPWPEARLVDTRGPRDDSVRRARELARP